jgi:hypothetical protein
MFASVQAQLQLVQNSFDSGGQIAVQGSLYALNSFGEVFVSEAEALGTSTSEGFIHPQLLISTAVHSPNANTFKIYPNPANELLFIETGTIIAQQIRLTDVSGKVIYSEAIEQNKTQINMAHLEQGIYFIHIQFEGQTETIKVIKQ